MIIKELFEHFYFTEKGTNRTTTTFKATYFRTNKMTGSMAGHSLKTNNKILLFFNDPHCLRFFICKDFQQISCLWIV